MLMGLVGENSVGGDTVLYIELQYFLNKDYKLV